MFCVLFFSSFVFQQKSGPELLDLVQCNLEGIEDLRRSEQLLFDSLPLYPIPIGLSEANVNRLQCFNGP